ncbi:gamma-glutamylcyclotransferase [Shimia sp.]|uniref:gamma-glutamylcyclotransferase n=1 Tax=Shimia sp. TaxID=1954381 RepID=UPI003296CB4F
MSDPFCHHPRLAGLITPPAESSFREFDPANINEIVRANGAPEDWMLSDELRSADRMATLEGRWEQDLWVFAYGSLMWDPGVHFDEVRRGFAPGVERRFILCDRFGGRGTQDAPGVMAALETGAGCNGLAFRVTRDNIDCETELLWRRERLGNAYHSEFIAVETDHGTIQALAFLANHEAELIVPDLSHEDQVRYCATGKGWLGTSFDYVANLAEHFETMGIEDAGVTRLLRDARAFRGE